jgi:hypothetical protein
MNTSIDTTILDGIIVGRVDPHIYAFSTGTIPNYLKVGDTYRPVNVRLDEWRLHYKDLEPLYEHIAKVDNGNIFRDYSVHYFLEHDKNLKRLEQGTFALAYYSREFFKDATTADVDEAIADICRSARENDGKYKLYSPDFLPVVYKFEREEIPWDLRPNQQEAVDNFKEAVINKHRSNLLMYAVMRFGKSFTAMSCAVEIQANFVVIVSAKADVKVEWQKTVEVPANFKGYHFFDSNSLLANPKAISDALQQGTKAVLFLTLQDLQGDDIKLKHKDVFANTIDLLIVDETHYGARGEEYGKVLRNSKLTKAQISKELEECEISDDFDEPIKGLNYKIQLHLSGTPYRILMNDEEFTKDDIIAFCQFTDIVNEQKQWDKEHLAEDGVKEWDNPYYGFPQMIRFAFNPNESSRKLLEQLKKNGVTYAFSELFRPQSITKDRAGKYKEFVHKREILDLLQIIDGSKQEDDLLGFLDYDKIKNGQMCRHIVCVLPFRASCDAMAALIKSNKKLFQNFCKYEIINIAGVEDEYDSTKSVIAKIKECEEAGKKTLTLTVNKMLTGSTVEQWDTMLYLKDTASPQEYDQAIFRIQNQYVKTYTDGENVVKYNMKPQTLLVDFDPNRLFRLQELKSQFYNVNVDRNGNLKLEQRIREELAISPIIILNSNKIKEVTPANILDAVREYSKSKSVLEEAVDIPFDMGLLDDPVLKEEIEKLKEIDASKGLEIRPLEDDDDDDLDIPSPDDDNTSEKDKGKKDKDDNSKNNSEQDDIKSLEKKLSAYYSKILFYAFLTDSKIMSLEQVIDSIALNDNNDRIRRNLGLRVKILKLIQKKCNPFVLSKLDFKIQNINSLMQDDSLLPLERAKVAIKKFTRISDSEVVTPAYIANELVSFLPTDKISDKTIFLDIASKQGELAIALFERYSDVPNIKGHIYSLPTSHITYELTRKMYEILGLPTENVIKGYYSADFIIGNEGLANVVRQIHPTVIIGGPPFNTNDGGGRGDSASALYHRYVQVAKEYEPDYISMYMKAVWYSGGKGQGLNDFRLEMLDDTRISIFSDYPNPKECQIEGINLRGGVCAFLWDASHQGNCRFISHINGKEYRSNRFLRTDGENILIRYPQGLSILEKVKALGEDVFSNWVSGRDPFGLGDSFDAYKPNPIGTYTTKLYCERKEIGYIKWNQVDKEYRPLSNKWKVLVAKASPGEDTLPHSIISAPIISEPKSVCTNGLFVVKTLNSKREAQNLIDYMHTSFFRFMMLLAKNGHNLTNNVYRYVPVVDLSKKWTDAALFKRYGIIKSEQDFIKSVIKDIND